MGITEINIKLADRQKEGTNGRLCAFVSIVLGNEWIIQELKVVDGMEGLFLSMPSRKLMDHCPDCWKKNCLRVRFCNHCGRRLPVNNNNERIRLYEDIVHPINYVCRHMATEAVLKVYKMELEFAKNPGYVFSFYSYLLNEKNGALPLRKEI